MRPQICIDNTVKPISAELPTQETPRQNWAETIQEVIQQEQEKAERRLAEERAGMEETIQERVASVEQHYKEQASRTIAERVRMEADAAEQRLARQREEYEAKLREAGEWREEWHRWDIAKNYRRIKKEVTA